MDMEVDTTEAVKSIYLFLGLLLGFTAEIWVGMANIQIKYSHKLDSVSHNPKAPYRRCRWWFGFSLYILNITFNLASFMFASLNILAPTSALVIVINAVLARWYFNEKLTFFGILGSISIMIGCIFTILFGTHTQDDMTIDSLLIYAATPVFILFTSIHGFLCIIFGGIGVRMHQKYVLYQHSSTKHLLNPIEMNPIIISDDSDDKSDDNDDIDDDNKQTEHDSDSSISASETTTTTPSSIIPILLTKEDINRIKNEEFRHILRCFLMSFATAGLVAWIQMLGKISADLLFESLFNNNNQFNTISPFIVVIILVIMLFFELYFMSEIMRIFDAVLVVPIYNSLQILASIALSAVYFNNFADFSITDSCMFIIGLLLIFGGITSISYGQKRQSMVHHEDDQKRYIISAKKKHSKSNNKNNKNQINQESLRRNLSLTSINNNDIQQILSS